MALDRFVWWQKERPTDEQVRFVLEDYLGGVGTIEDKKQKDGHSWFFITLPGNVSKPFRRVLPEDCKHMGEPSPLDPEERWFEVCLQSNNADVMTRTADEFTNVIAEGFVRLICRYWGARWDDGGHTNLDGTCQETSKKTTKTSKK